MPLPQYTYSDYVHWKGRWEVIEGVPYAMSPMPIPKHQRIASVINGLFFIALRNCKPCTVYEPIDYKVRENTILQPDLLILCKEIEKPFLDFPPELIVEILSPDTASKDRLYKFNTYQQQGVKYYLIVEPQMEQIEVYELQNDAYKMMAEGRDFTFRFSFSEGCEAAIDFAEVWE